MRITDHESPQFAYEDMIRRIMRRNYPLLHALRLELEDVYQDLALTAIQASRAFDPARSGSLEAHVWMKLQYAILDMKRDHCPGGLTGLNGARPCLNSVEYDEERGFPLAAPEYGDPVSDLRLQRALSCLDPQKRYAVVLYLEGDRPGRKQRDCFLSAVEKLRAFYLAQAVSC